MSDLKNYADLTIKQDANVSGTMTVKSDAAFNANIVTSSDGLYDIDNAFHALDEKTIEYKQNIKSAYEGARFKYTGSFNASGLASINLTSLAPSGTTYFNTSSIDKVDVQILVDTGNNLHYTNDLVSVELSASQNHLFLNLEALGAANKDFRILAINEVDFISINSGGSSASNNSGSSSTPVQIVVVISDWTQETTLLGSYVTTASVYDDYGWAVAINDSGNRVAVTAPGDEKSATHLAYGVAYIFSSSSVGWTEEASLIGSTATTFYDNAGWSVKFNSNGNRIFIGAPLDEKYGTGIESGLTYVFSSGSNGWAEEAILSGSLAINASDNFGHRLSVSSNGNKVIVGAHNDERYNGQSSSGLAYVFSSGSSGWVEEAVLSGSIATNGSDFFGVSVGMNNSGDVVAVGARQDESPTRSSATGLVYIFTSSSFGWSEQSIISGSLATQTDDWFGHDLSINGNGDKLLVTAAQDEVSSNTNSGLAYIFSSGSNGWTEEWILSGSFASQNTDSFGHSDGPCAAINSLGNIAVVGARGDGTGATQTGLAYVFVSSSSGWNQKKILSGSYAVNSGDYFGTSVDINSDGARIIIGARYDETSGTYGSGLAYVFSGSHE